MTLSKYYIKSILFVAFYGMTQAYAANIERGKELHDGYCISCHASMLGGDGTAIYTRVERRIDSMEALQHQVRRCKTSLDASWPDDQVDDLLEYLNQTFYKFSATP